MKKVRVTELDAAKLGKVSQFLGFSCICSCLFLLIPKAIGQSEENVLELEEYVIADNIQSAMIVPTDRPVSSTFGFAEEFINIPRSVSVVTGEQMEIFDIDLEGNSRSLGHFQTVSCQTKSCNVGNGIHLKFF